MSGLRRWILGLVAVTMLGSLLSLIPMTALAAGEANDIMWAGAADKTAFLNKVANGDGHNSARNLQTIYYKQGRGITEANFKDSVDGMVYKDGRVVVNGKTVATEAVSVGRSNISGSWDDHGLYARPTSVSFQSNSLPAFVYLSNGVFTYAIIKDCGNPVSAAPVKSSPSPSPQVTSKATPKVTPKAVPSPSPSPDASQACRKLTPSRPHANSEPGLFRFTVSSQAPSGAKIQGYRFGFDDGTEDIETASNRNYVERTLEADQTLTVRAWVVTSAGESDDNDACSATVMVHAASKSGSTPPPSPSPSSKPVDKGQVLGVSLPDTGPEAALGGAVGLGAMGSAAVAYRRSRRSLLSALRRRP